MGEGGGGVAGKWVNLRLLGGELCKPDNGINMS